MKIIHCADLHLDSHLTSHLPKEKAEIRRAELLLSFRNLVQYAAEQQVRAVLISGDLFDSSIIRKTAENAFLAAVSQHPEIDFYYIRGNHDTKTFADHFDRKPENLHFFSEEFISYDLEKGQKIEISKTNGETTEDFSGRIIVSGLDYRRDYTNAGNEVPSFLGAFHIVMLHGELVLGPSGNDGSSQSPAARSVGEQAGGTRAGSISLRDFKDRGINYLALGHIHKREDGGLDATGMYAYPGCLVGRGFDEPGEHGFYLLDIENGVAERHFVTVPGRKIMVLPVDVSGSTSTGDVLERVDSALRREDFGSEDLLKIVLTGRLYSDVELDERQLTAYLKQLCFAEELENRTVRYLDPESFRGDTSLKGEFVRCVESDQELDEEMKAAAAGIGIRLLSGETAEEIET